MKAKKDIFDRFRESSHKLDEMPSPQAWRKLDSRLELHQNRSRSNLYRSLAMVAAVVALVAITFVISLMMEQQKRNHALAENLRPQQIEVLEAFTDATLEAYQIVEFTRQHTSRLSNPVAEGYPGKKLQVSYGVEETGATVTASKSAARNKALQEKNKRFASFRKLLYSPDIQNFFAGEGTIYVYSSETLCQLIDCQRFRLEKSKQEVFFAVREDLFMRGNPNYLLIESIRSDEDGQLQFEYALKGKTK